MKIFKNKWWLVVFFVVFLLIIGSIIFKNNQQWNYKVQTIAENAKVVAFGDSLTYGYSLSEGQDYPTQLASLMGGSYHISNYGINGNTTQDGLERVREMLEKEKPELVILGLGGNDILKNVNRTETVRNLEEMIEIIQNHNAQVVLLPVPNFNMFGNITGLKDAEFYQTVSENKKVPMIENVFSELLSQKKYKVDLIHLNKEGYGLVAKKIYEEMRANKLIK